MDVAALPFNRWLGLRTEGDTVRLTPTADHTNHLNTVHAAVVFSIAESAAGHWLATQYPELEQDYIAVLRNSSTKYRRPATRDAELVGTAEVAAGGDDFLNRLQQRNRVLLDIEVDVRQNEQQVFRGTFGWFVTSR